MTAAAVVNTMIVAGITMALWHAIRNFGLALALLGALQLAVYAAGLMIMVAVLVMVGEGAAALATLVLRSLVGGY